MLLVKTQTYHESCYYLIYDKRYSNEFYFDKETVIMEESNISLKNIKLFLHFIKMNILIQI